MKSSEKRKLQMFRRALGWLLGHPDLEGTQQTGPQLVTAGRAQKANSNNPITNAAGINSAAGVAQQISTLEAVVSEITATASAQEGFDRTADGAAADIVRLRNVLITDQMRHIAIVAETTIPDVVRMTVALRRPGYRDAEGVILSADAMADAAVDYEDVLVQHGLPANFIAELRAKTAEFKQAIDTRGASVGQRHHAGEALYALIQRGNRVIDAISVLVARRYRGDAATLAEWKQVKHVVLVGARSAADVAPVPAPVHLPPTPLQVLPTPLQVSPTQLQVAPAAEQQSPAAAA